VGIICLLLVDIGLIDLPNLGRGVKSFIDNAADCFDNRRGAERVTSTIQLLANCRYLCPEVYKLLIKKVPILKSITKI
jgi:hypothetical protein